MVEKKTQNASEEKSGEARRENEKKHLPKNNIVISKFEGTRKISWNLLPLFLPGALCWKTSKSCAAYLTCFFTMNEIRGPGLLFSSPLRSTHFTSPLKKLRSFIETIERFYGWMAVAQYLFHLVEYVLSSSYSQFPPFLFCMNKLEYFL